MEDMLHVLASWISAGANTDALVRDRYHFRRASHGQCAAEEQRHIVST